ncbi:MAG TPA: DUF2298 domain-containing protein [Methylomirabilota bacterium]|nr:DUF2298 domain-containing protein [Methylomirabilota bacterium]
MIFSDSLATLQWWFVLFLLGIGFLPLTFVLFKNFFDKGYIFAKLIGLAVASYAIFLLGLFHIVPFSIGGSYGIFLIVAAIFLFLLRKTKPFSIIKKHWFTFATEEIIFLAALFFWAYIHSFAPDIHGLEKYMDFGFINSILRADYFPPKDMWFTPFFINYYYFGHLMTAVLTKLSNLPSNVTFNLMLSSIFAFCFTETFSLGANLYSFLGEKVKLSTIKRSAAGLLTALLVTLGGNLHILYAFFKAYPNENPVPIWQLPFLPFSFPNNYWYPNATRFIYHTIHEFPIYSWTVADLHGHVLDIPFVLLTIAVSLSFFIEKLEEKNTKKDSGKARMTSLWGEIKRLQNLKYAHLLVLSFLLAIMYMTNAWDGAIYFLLIALILLYLAVEKKISYKKTLLSFAIVLLGFIIFSYPYNSNFKPFVSGIGVLCIPDFLVAKQKIGPFLFEANHCQHSLWWELLILYGFFYFFVISFLIFTFRVKKLLATDQFVLLLIILSTLLILIPEFIYVKDIYPAHYRANTMFKLVFQAFMLLAISSGYIMVRLISEIKNQKPKTKILYSLFFLFSLLLFIVVMLYPYQAINAYYGNLKTYYGLNGTAYLQTLYPADYKAIHWINEHIKGQPIILEAQGDSYTDYGRVSTNTGLPTVLGWTVHEWLWRGTYDIPAPRINEVKTMYETTDVKEANTLLKKYNVKYVFIGALEYQKYPLLDETKFKELGKVAYHNGMTKIYQIN